MLFVHIALMNLLVAMFTDTFRRIHVSARRPNLGIPSSDEPTRESEAPHDASVRRQRMMPMLAMLSNTDPKLKPSP